jgi:thioredoxin-like negative regulator of GroEL
VIATLSLAALLVGGTGGNATPHEGIRWERNFEEAMKRARLAGKPLMIDFWANWCGWCHRLDQTTYVDPTVTKLAEDFVPVKVNTEGGMKDEQIARRYGVSSLPTIAFVSPSGRPLMRLTGFQGPGQFPKTLEVAKQMAIRVMAMEEALQKNPRDSVALGGMGVHLFEQESYDESRQFLDKALRHDADRPAEERKRTRMMLGAIHQYDSRLAEAEVLFKEALQIKPASDVDARVMYLLGKTYLAWGRQGEGRAMMQRVVSEYPSSSVAQKAHQTLQQLNRR